MNEPTATTAAPPSSAEPVVVLIHGMGLRGQGFSMRPLARRLRMAGLTAVCVDYPAAKMTMAEAADSLRGRVEPIADRAGRIHLVGHSLGGLLAVRLADALPDAQIARLVQLGSPNQGSPLAAMMRRVEPVRRTLGPVLEELAVEREADGETASCRVGAIAGVTSWGPMSAMQSRFAPDLAARFAEETDGKVTVASALAIADEAAVVPVGHAFLPTSRRVAACVVSYLRTGYFPDEMRVPLDRR